MSTQPVLDFQRRLHYPRPRFDVDQDIGYPRQIVPADPVPHMLCDLMRSAHRDLRIHFQMQIDMILKTRLAGEALLDPGHVPHAESHFADLLHRSLIRHRVHQDAYG